MKAIPLAVTLLASSLAYVTPLRAQEALKDDPAYLDINAAIDLTEIKPEVNVNIPKFLLKNALAEFDGGKDDPIASLGINLHELTSEVKLVRIVVIDAKPQDEDAIKTGIQRLKDDLEASWIPIVSVPADNVFIYARSNASGEDLAGLALIVADGREVVIGNVVGNVPIGKIAKLAARVGGDMIPAEVLEKLGGLQQESEEAHHDGEHDHHDDAHEEAL